MEDTKTPPLTNNGEGGISRSAPAMDSAKRDQLAAYLMRIRPSTVTIEVPGVRLRLWWVALTSCYHAEISFTADDLPPDDDSVIEERSPILCDLLAYIQETHAASYAALYDRVVIDFYSESCYHKH